MKPHFSAHLLKLTRGTGQNQFLDSYSKVISSTSQCPHDVGAISLDLAMT